MIGKVTVTSTGPAKYDPTLDPATDLLVFIGILTRAGIGHGVRHDYNPSVESVQVEHPHDMDDGFHVTDWSFGADGKLKGVGHYEGEVG